MKTVIFILLMILGTNLVANTSAKVDVFQYIKSIVNVENKSKISPIVSGEKDSLLSITNVEAISPSELSYTIAYNLELISEGYDINNPEDQYSLSKDLIATSK